MHLTVGKIRGLQQISTSRGIFTMTAMDQRGSLQEMVNPTDPDSINYEAMKRFKLELADVFSPLSSAILLDPIYGAAEAIAHGALRGQCGLLVAVEESGYTSDGSGRLTTFMKGWDVRKIKLMGASAVKLLVYYNPDEPTSAQHQRDVVRQVVADCTTWDIPSVVEAVAYPLGTMNKNSREFADIKPDLVIRSARELTPLGFDLFKAEFPADYTYEQDEQKLADWCQQLDAATPMPWVILSAGVDIGTFRKQVEIACKNGASGFLAGRAIWKESVVIPDHAARLRHLRSVSTGYLASCIELAEKHATPWQKKLGQPLAEKAAIHEGWMHTYAQEP